MKDYKNIRDSYSLYKENITNPVEVKTYIEIASKYMKFLVDKVLEGETITLPARLGTLAVLGKKQEIKFDEKGNVKGLAPDWVKTKLLWGKNPKAKKEGKIVFHTNEHTDGFRYKYLWSKNRVLVANKTLYSLRMTRANKRAIHKKLIEGNEYEIIQQ